MNIFKVLSNGDGSINEPNISAFLGFLLDPNTDHGININFLVSFLNVLKGSEENLTGYDFKVFFEQAFKDQNDSKQIVDIVLVKYKSTHTITKETLFEDFISNSKKITDVYLIECKIKGAPTNSQLFKQYKSSLKILEDYNVKSNAFYVYLTPNSDKFIKDFNASNILNKYHVTWDSIIELLRILLNKENTGEIEPINEYTRHTIKAFIQFIESDFTSQKQEEKERKFKKDISEDLNEFLEKHKEKLSPLATNILQVFSNYLHSLNNKSISLKHSPGNPCSVYLKDRKIFHLTRSGSNIKVALFYRSYPLKSRKEFMQSILNLGHEFRETNYSAFDITSSITNAEQVIDLFKLHLKSIQYT